MLHLLHQRENKLICYLYSANINYPLVNGWKLVAGMPQVPGFQQVVQFLQQKLEKNTPVTLEAFRSCGQKCTAKPKWSLFRSGVYQTESMRFSWQGLTVLRQITYRVWIWEGYEMAVRQCHCCEWWFCTSSPPQCTPGLYNSPPSASKCHISPTCVSAFAWNCVQIGPAMLNAYRPNICGMRWLISMHYSL